LLLNHLVRHNRPDIVEKSDLINHIGQRLYVRYSIHSCVGTLVGIHDTVAEFDNSHQIYIPAIDSVTTELPKPRAPATSLPVNLLDLFK
jgi:hypothetical protein